MEKTNMEKQIEQWFENRKRDRTDPELERINKHIQTDEHRMVKNRYMPFFGNPNAKIVYCNLNPGNASLIGSRENSSHLQFIRQYEKCLTYDTSDDLIKFLRNFGDFASLHFNMKFDRKQLVFLYGFHEIANENGIDIGMGFQGGINLEKAGLMNIVREKVNQRNLFNNRLQLELIPYASNQFDARTIPFHILCEYFEKLLDEVFSAPRKLVLLQGNVYCDLLSVSEGVEKIGKFEMVSTNAHMFLYRIMRNGQALFFIVASTFQGRNVQSYTGGYQYGKFCADVLFKYIARQ